MFAFNMGVIAAAARLASSGGSGHPVATNLVFEVLASKYTSGQTLANTVTAPADGSAQTAYDWMFGSSTSSSTDDPTHTTGATPYFAFDGGDYFTLNAATTTFFKNMHKSGSKFTIEIWMQWGGATASNVTPLFDSGTSDQGGADTSRGVIFADLGGGSTPSPGKNGLRVKRDSSGANAVVATAVNAIPSNSLQMLAVSFDGTGAAPSFLYRNGAYDPVASGDTWDGTLASPGTSDATNLPHIGARGDGAFKVPSGTRLYGMRVYNTNLSKSQLDQNYAAGVGASATDIP